MHAAPFAPPIVNNALRSAPSGSPPASAAPSFRRSAPPTKSVANFPASMALRGVPPALLLGNTRHFGGAQPRPVGVAGGALALAPVGNGGFGEIRNGSGRVGEKAPAVRRTSGPHEVGESAVYADKKEEEVRRRELLAKRERDAGAKAPERRKGGRVRWVESADEDGTPFWYDKKTHTSTWDDPSVEWVKYIYQRGEREEPFWVNTKSGKSFWWDPEQAEKAESGVGFGVCDKFPKRVGTGVQAMVLTAIDDAIEARFKEDFDCEGEALKILQAESDKADEQAEGNPDARKAMVARTKEALDKFDYMMERKDFVEGLLRDGTFVERVAGSFVDKERLQILEKEANEQKARKLKEEKEKHDLKRRQEEQKQALLEQKEKREEREKLKKRKMEKEGEKEKEKAEKEIVAVDAVGDRKVDKTSAIPEPETTEKASVGANGASGGHSSPKAKAKVIGEGPIGPALNKVWGFRKKDKTTEKSGILPAHSKAGSEDACDVVEKRGALGSSIRGKGMGVREDGKRHDGGQCSPKTVDLGPSYRSGVALKPDRKGKVGEKKEKVVAASRGGGSSNLISSRSARGDDGSTSGKKADAAGLPGVRRVSLPAQTRDLSISRSSSPSDEKLARESLGAQKLSVIGTGFDLDSSLVVGKATRVTRKLHISSVGGKKKELAGSHRSKRRRSPVSESKDEVEVNICGKEVDGERKIVGVDESELTRAVPSGDKSYDVPRREKKRKRTGEKSREEGKALPESDGKLKVDTLSAVENHSRRRRKRSGDELVVSSDKRVASEGIAKLPGTGKLAGQVNSSGDSSCEDARVSLSPVKSGKRHASSKALQVCEETAEVASASRRRKDDTVLDGAGAIEPPSPQKDSLVEDEYLEDRGVHPMGDSRAEVTTRQRSGRRLSASLTKAGSIRAGGEPAPSAAGEEFSSSRRVADGSDRESLRRVQKLVVDLKKLDDAALFAEPVNEEDGGCENYYTEIAHPMDIGTILSRLDDEHYKQVADVLSDVDLIWKNCFQYNGDADPVSGCAKKCQKKFSKWIEKEFPELSVENVRSTKGLSFAKKHEEKEEKKQERESSVKRKKRASSSEEVGGSKKKKRSSSRRKSDGSRKGHKPPESGENDAAENAERPLGGPPNLQGQKLVGARLSVFTCDVPGLPREEDRESVRWYFCDVLSYDEEDGTHCLEWFGAHKRKYGRSKRARLEKSELSAGLGEDLKIYKVLSLPR